MAASAVAAAAATLAIATINESRDIAMALVQLRAFTAC